MNPQPIRSASSETALTHRNSSASRVHSEASSHNERAPLLMAYEDACVLDTVRMPPRAGLKTSLQLGATIAQALPMIAFVSRVAQPGPRVAPDAPESVERWPRQRDVEQRQDSVIFSRQLASPSAGPTLPTRRAWLAEPREGFWLSLGAGFICMYQHAGAVLALEELGLSDHARGVAGVSSGAITAALWATRGSGGMVEALLSLSILDFLDLSWRDYMQQGALCAGQAVERKIARECEQAGQHRIEDVTRLPLRIGVFDGELGRTLWRSEGPLAKTVTQSAALPLLFANDGRFIDGGWIDQHGVTALPAGERGLSLRVNTAIKTDGMQALVSRPTPLFDVSEDPAHLTVCLMPKHKISVPGFLVDIDFRKDKLMSIMRESRELMLGWLLAPA